MAIIGLTIQEWQLYHQEHDKDILLTLETLLKSLSTIDNAWIYLTTLSQIKNQLENQMFRWKQDKQSLPFFGVPFAVKDNIDVAGWPTSAACPAFTYIAKSDAFVVAKLKAAGAVVIGKNNLDQYATGLVGTRSPFGKVCNTFNSHYISGGSSSGSASVTARGLVCFALGTDTAGSGRIPASFNNIVGLKPTKGWLSTRGVVPACRLNDTISIFALTVQDAFMIANYLGDYDSQDEYSRNHTALAPASMPEKPHFAVPIKPKFYGDKCAEKAWENAVKKLITIGVKLHYIDFTIFYKLAQQLYCGPWVAERTVSVGDMLKKPELMDPVVHTIISNGMHYSAVDAYKAEYLRAKLTRNIQKIFSKFDALVVPTSPTIRTIKDIEKEPIKYNAQFGIYTNFTNLADLSALALPGPFRNDGLPAGITLIAPAWHDRALATFGCHWQKLQGISLGATGRKLPSLPTKIPISAQHVRIAVCGAHLNGMPLNYQLRKLNAVLVKKTTTANNYCLYVLTNTTPPKPVLIKNNNIGTEIIVELWDIPLASFGKFVLEVPEPLGIGTVELSDGNRVKGFICEPNAIHQATDITSYGSWKYWLTREEKTDV